MKAKRQEKIIEIIEQYNIETQDELAEKLASKIIARRRLERQNEAKGERDKTSSDYQLELLAAINERKNEEIRQLHEEQRILRALASSGLMLASFAHDLSKLKLTLGSRYDDIKSLFLSKLDKSEFPNESLGNPFILLDRARQDDVKMTQWLNFSIGIIKKDKRKRTSVLLVTYFTKLQDAWAGLFAARRIRFIHDDIENVSMHIYEIDLDSIFYNLFSNSVEAFIRSKEDSERKIEVTVKVAPRNLIITYQDSGPGLSEDIVNPDDIFKVNPNGAEDLS